MLVDPHHEKKPVEMSKEAKEVDYDRSLFGPDPFYEDKPYDVEEQLKIYGGKYKIENTISSTITGIHGIH